MERHRRFDRIALAAIFAATVILGVSPPGYPLGLEKAPVLAPGGAEAGFLSPTGLWYDGQRGHLIVASPLLHRVTVLDRHGSVVKVLGREGNLRFPRAVAAARDGTLYIAGRESERVRVLAHYGAASLEEYTEVDLSPHRRSAQVQPTALHVDEKGILYVADRGNRQILALRPDGKLKAAITDVGEPADVWTDGPGRIYVADPAFGGIRVYDPEGRYLRTLGANTPQFREPLRVTALVIDSRGRIWILEEGGRGIKALDSLGNLLFSRGGEGLVAPADLAVDSQENLYVLEEGGNRISVFSIVGI